VNDVFAFLFGFRLDLLYVEGDELQGKDVGISEDKLRTVVDKIQSPLCRLSGAGVKDDFPVLGRRTPVT